MYVATVFMVHLGTLERMNLHYLQKELLEVVRRIIEDERAGGTIMRDARTLLAEYGMFMIKYFICARRYWLTFT
jgi:hypothetical protein